GRARQPPCFGGRKGKWLRLARRCSFFTEFSIQGLGMWVSFSWEGGRKRLLQAALPGWKPQEACHGREPKKPSGNKKSRVSAPSRAPTRFECVSAGAPLPQDLLFASQEGRREETVPVFRLSSVANGMPGVLCFPDRNPLDSAT